ESCTRSRHIGCVGKAFQTCRPLALPGNTEGQPSDWLYLIQLDGKYVRAWKCSNADGIESDGRNEKIKRFKRGYKIDDYFFSVEHIQFDAYPDNGHCNPDAIRIRGAD